MANSKNNRKKKKKHGADNFFDTDSVLMDQFCEGLNIFKDRYFKNIYIYKNIFRVNFLGINLRNPFDLKCKILVLQLFSLEYRFEKRAINFDIGFVWKHFQHTSDGSKKERK